MHIGVILSLEGSGICFFVLVDKQFCNFDLLLIYALEGSFRPSCIFFRRALLFPSISLSVYQYYFWRRPNIPKFIELMTTTNTIIIRNLASYVYEAFRVRNQ